MTVVVITGGTRGIGRGLASAFLDRGCRVVMCGRDPNAVRAADEELGDNALAVRADVTSGADLEKLWATAVERFGRVDHWINNAGIAMTPRLLWEIPEQDTRDVVEINLIGPINGSALAIAHMLDQGGGFVWNMVGFGSNGRISRGMTIYGATKRALAYLHETLVLETKGTPVRVGLLSPGLVITELVAHNALCADVRGKWQRIFYEVLSDPLAVVAPWMVDRILGARCNGARAERLTKFSSVARLAVAFARGRIRWRPSTSEWDAATNG